MEQFSFSVARGGRISSRDSCMHNSRLTFTASTLGAVCVWLIIYLWICECGRVQSARLRLRPPRVFRSRCSEEIIAPTQQMSIFMIFPAALALLRSRNVYTALMENNTWRYNSQFEITSYKAHVIKNKQNSKKRIQERATMYKIYLYEKNVRD